jgi:hypothetical protein
MDLGRRGFRLVGGDFVLRGRIADRVSQLGLVHYGRQLRAFVRRVIDASLILF